MKSNQVVIFMSVLKWQKIDAVRDNELLKVAAEDAEIEETDCLDRQSPSPYMTTTTLFEDIRSPDLQTWTHN